MSTSNWVVRGAFKTSTSFIAAHTNDDDNDNNDNDNDNDDNNNDNNNDNDDDDDDDDSDDSDNDNDNDNDDDDDDDDDDDNDEQQIEIQNSEVNEMNGKILYKKIEYDITCNTYPCTCHKLEGISIHYQLLEYKIL